MSEDHWPKTDGELAEWLGCSKSRVRTLRQDNLQVLKEGGYFTRKYHPSNAQPLYLWEELGGLYLAELVKSDRATRQLSARGRGRRLRNRIGTELTRILIEAFRDYSITIVSEQGLKSRRSEQSRERVDVYIPELSLAIEWDERDHAGYDVFDEEYREDLFRERLNCTFLRYNTNGVDTVGTVIRRILAMLKERGLLI